MKRNITKGIALALALVMVASLGACAPDSGSNGTSAANTSAANTSAASSGADSSAAPDADRFADPMKISIAVWGIGDMITDAEDPIRDALYEKFNIEIEPYPVTWGDYSEKILLWASTQSLPDMTAFEAATNSNTFEKWVSQGVVRQLPTDLSQYPNIAALMATEDALVLNRAKSVSDPLYGVPRPNITNSESFINEVGAFIRKDWMEAVGVTTVPATADELFDLAVKFQENDPDGNGKKDTIGITGYTYAWMSYLLNGDAPAAVNGFRWVYADDGTIVPVWATEDFLNGMQTMNKFYKAGLLDPDYIILSGEEGRDKFKNGLAGIYMHSGPYYGGSSNMYAHFQPKIDAGEFGADKTFSDIITWLPWFNTESGHPEYPTGNLFWSETYLSKSVDDAKADRCLALLDYLISAEGYLDLALGVEGVDYKYNADGTYEAIPTLKEDGSVMSIAQKYKIAGLPVLGGWSGFYILDNPAAYPELIKMNDDAIDYALNTQNATPADLPRVSDLILTESIDYDTAGADYARILNDIMTADDVRAKWEETVNTLMSSGYDKVIAEMNSLYTAAGR